jgi:hypothetical protein
VSVDEVLATDSVVFSVIVEVADAGDEVPGFLGDRIIEDDIGILRPACFTVFWEFFEAFVVELLFIPVVLGEEFVESAFVSSRKASRAMPATVLLLAATRPVA